MAHGNDAAGGDTGPTGNGGSRPPSDLPRRYRVRRPIPAAFPQPLPGLDEVPPDSPSLFDLAQDYLAVRHRAGQLAKTTLPSVRCVLFKFANSVFCVPPGRVTRHDVEAFVGAPGLAPQSRRHRLSILKNFWRWLLAEGHAVADPTVGVARVRQPRLLPRGLSAAQVAAVLAVVPDSRGRLCVLLMAQEGLRTIEVVRLELGDFDLRERTMLVNGKGGHQRLLPVTTETWEALGVYLAEHPAAFGPLIRSFTEPTDGLTANHLCKLVSRWMRAAGVAETGHALRHTCASDLLNNGVHVRNVQAVLGHANLATTSRYLPLVVGELAEAMGGRRYGGGR